MSYKIKLFGHSGCGKSTHLNLWSKANDHLSIINDKFLSDNELELLHVVSRPEDARANLQCKILKNYWSERSQVDKNKNNSLLFEHTPIEMIDWYTERYKDMLSSSDYEQLKSSIENAKQLDDKEYKIINVYFQCNDPKFLEDNIKFRNRRYETFDLKTFEFIERKLNEHIKDSFEIKKQPCVFITCKRNEFSYNALDEILSFTTIN